MNCTNPEDVPNKYDNDVTLLYKRAQCLTIPTTRVTAPTRFLFRRPAEAADPAVIQDLGLDYDSVFYALDLLIVENPETYQTKDPEIISYGEISSLFRGKTQATESDLPMIYFTTLRQGPFQRALGPHLSGVYINRIPNLETAVALSGLEVPDVMLPGTNLGVPRVSAVEYYDQYYNRPITKVSTWFEPETLAFLSVLYGKEQEFPELYRAVGSVDPRDLNKIRVTSILEDRQFDLAFTRGEQDEVLRRINLFLSSLGNSTRYGDYSLLLRAYQEWLLSAKEVSSREEEHLSRILKVQEVLASVDTDTVSDMVALSPLTLEDSIYSFGPKLNGSSVTAGDGLDVFNQAVPSMFVPHIKYVDEGGRAYHRVYTGSKSQPNFNPNYSYSLIPEEKSLRPNTLYLRLWLGVNPKLFSRAVKPDFYISEYRLDSNYLKVKASVGSVKRETEDVAISRIKAALPTLEFGPASEVSVSASFALWGESLVPTSSGQQVKELWLEMSSFLEMLLLDDVMNEYLYLQENATPYAMKKQLRLQYRAMFGDRKEGDPTPSIVFSLSNQTANATNTATKTRDYSHKVEHQVTVPRGLNYFSVSVNNADSKAALNRFMLILQLLFQYYVKQREQVYSQIYARIPQLQSKPGDVEVTQVSASRIQSLKEAYPEMFGNSYPSTCIAKHQPILISDGEMDSWKQKTVGGLPREVATLTNQNGQEIHLVCPDDSYPYPGYKRNTKTDSDVLCCYKSRSVGDRGIATGTKANYTLTAKIVDPNSLAALPSGVERVLKQIHIQERTPVVHITEWSRYGVPISPNSFLHCVLNAVEDPGYQNSRGSETYVSRVRDQIARATQPGLLKQELYDYELPEICQVLQNSDTFFDPALFYRSVEEYYNINIYVWSRQKQADPVGYLEVPRYRLFHARPERLDRPTVMVFKSIGSKRDVLEYPHCELVVAQSADNLGNRKLLTRYFGPEITRGLHQTLMATLATYTFEIGREITAYGNLVYLWDTLGSTGQYPVLSQHVDPNGKMRVVDLEIGGRAVSLVTPPTQPENLPLRRPGVGLDPINLSEAKVLLGQPSGRGKRGIWFPSLGLKYALYLAVTNTQEIDPALPYHTDPETSATSNSDLTRVIKLRRTINIIVELVSWIFSVYERSGGNAGDFAREYFLVHARKVDSADYYDLTHLSRKLPSVKIDLPGISQILTQLAVTVPTLVSNGKILMYSAEFAYRLTQTLQAEDPLAQYQPTLTEKSHLYSYFETDTDFRPVANSKIFTSDQALRTWRTGLGLDRQGLTVISTLPDVYSTIPYIYRDQAGRLFLIQGVYGERKESSLSVAYIWDRYHVNPGPSVEHLTWTPAHLVYGRSSTGKLEVFKDNTVADQPFLSILYHGDSKANLDKMVWSRYSAVLRLL